MSVPKKNRLAFRVVVLVGVLVLLMAASLSIGHVLLSPQDLMRALFGGSGSEIMRQIVVEIRMPRVLTAIFAGAALGVGGVLIQSLFRNPVADPWSLGLTAGGQLGVALAVASAAFAGPKALSFLAAFQGLSLTVAAAVGVLAAAMGMLFLGRRLSSVALLVVGLMTWFTAQGLVSIIMHFASRAGGRVYSGWNDGNFAGVTLEEFPTLAIPIGVGLVGSLVVAKPLTSLLLGEAYARSLGVDLVRTRLAVLGVTVSLVAPVTALCGPVTFIGLIVPHLARAMTGSAKVSSLLPFAAIAGGALALAADLVVHLPWPQHFLHLNAVLAVIGAPVVIGLLVFSPAMRGTRQC